APGGNLRPTAPGAGALDHPDCPHAHGGGPAARRRRGNRGRASVHADARCREAEFLRHHVGDAWRVPHPHRDAPGIHATPPPRQVVTPHEFTGFLFPLLVRGPLHNRVLGLELHALARSFLCHSERSEETRIFLGAKHFDFTEGTRSRAAPNSICSYAKVTC